LPYWAREALIVSLRRHACDRQISERDGYIYFSHFDVSRRDWPQSHRCKQGRSIW